ncbi:MAG: hypothetical protein U9R74_07640 [Pseudomonadota bacterium]|nr:hypothetical protein [Pseudomonadota bacterium]
MDDRTFADHYDRLAVILNRVHRVTALIAALSFLAYLGAGWLLFTGEPLLSLLLATGGYALFRSFRQISLGIARRSLIHRTEYRETFTLLDRELDRCGRAQALNGIAERLGKHERGTAEGGG